MKTLLVLAQHPGLAEALRAELSPEQYRVVHRALLEDAEPLLAHGLADACVLDVELTGVQGVWVLEKLRRFTSRCPIIVYADARQWEWEEAAYLQGVSYVLNKPVRARMLNSLLDRIWQGTAAPAPGAGAALPDLAPEPPPSRELPVVNGNSSQQPALTLLRDFSGILTHSLNADAMLNQFLLFLREIFSVNRSAIFLRQPFTPASFSTDSPAPAASLLRSASAIGLAPGLLQHLELSFNAGIGGHLYRSGRVLRRQSEEARGDVETQKEFELLGVQVAVPILDRENLLGIAVFDRRITGEPLTNPELELIFHFLEQLALAIKNIWLHEQLSSGHELLAEILRELSSACVVVSRDLAVLHANRTARKYFSPGDRRGEDFRFTDLPPAIGAKVYQVLKTGSPVSSFKYHPEDSPGTIYDVTIVPFQRPATGMPASAMMLVEDRTQVDQLQRLEIEAANLRLVKSMADRLTHEIGNAMVPLSTHQQLLADRWKDAEFRNSLDLALADGVKRVTRLVNQMRFLARDSLLSTESFPLTPLIEEAYQEARKYQPVKSAQLKYDKIKEPIVVTGDRAALKHALAEVMLNALQANPAEPKIDVRLRPNANGNGFHSLQIEVQDNGDGFTPESAQKGPAPFFTTRNVGLGLGLTVTRKIIETHHGKLEIIPPATGHSGVVRISLPFETTGETTKHE